MPDREGTDEIAALEAARAQLETALSNDARWQRVGEDVSVRDLREQEFAGNPLYQSWKLVNQAIENLRSAPTATGPVDEERQPEAQSQEAPDDLTCIAGISPALASSLAAIGITRYADIAAWRVDDVRDVSEALGLGDEISRENWIEQAALLEQGNYDRQPEITEQISVTDDAQTVVAPSVEPAEPAQEIDDPSVPAEAHDIDLPDILEAIRNDASAHGERPPAFTFDADEPQGMSEPLDASVDPPPVAAEQEPIASPPPVDVPPPVEHPDAEGDEEPVVAPPPVSPQRSPIPTVAASSHVNTDAAERARRLEEERRLLARNFERFAGPDGAAGPVHEGDEATVTFVIREPMRPAQQSVEEPAVTSNRRSPSFFEPSRKTGAREEESGELYAPPKGRAEEANVVIVTPETGSGEGSTNSPKGSRGAA